MSEVNIGFDQDILWEKLEKRRVALLTPRTLSDGYFSGPTGRQLEEIAYTHQFNEPMALLDLMSGKRVLDIGAGASEIGTEAEAKGILTNVVYLDVPSTFEKYFEPTSVRSEVGGYAQHLPFFDESFDLLLATYSLPTYCTSTDQIDGFIDEGIRVLRPGANFSMAPLQVWQGNNLQTREIVLAHLIQRLIDINASSGYSVELRGEYSPEAAVISKVE